MIIISKSIQLISITLEDQPQLMALMECIYPPAYKHLWKNQDCSFYLNHFYSFQNLKDELSEKDSDYYFVTYNSTPIGIYRLQYNQTLGDIPEITATYLHRIYLAQEAHGKGIAKQLLDWTENHIKQKENHLIWLKAMDTQQQALRFYEKQGFSKINTTALDFELLHKNLRGMTILHKIIN